jgi:hypothetical protein
MRRVPVVPVQLLRVDLVRTVEVPFSSLLRPRLFCDAYQLQSVEYDVSVQYNGCWKAQSPPVFVGDAAMQNAAGRSVARNSSVTLVLLSNQFLEFHCVG